MNIPSIYNYIKAILLAFVLGAFVPGQLHAQTTYSIKPVISVYPDAPTGNLNVKWENQPKGIAQLAIIDTAGNEVLTQTLHITAPSDKILIDLSSVPDGRYRVTVTSDNISFIGKLSILMQ